MSREVEIRDLGPSDSMAELTELLRDAYRELGDMGLNYTAVDQDVTVTERRISRGACLVAELEGDLVGTATWYAPGIIDACDWYRRPGVAVFGQFGVRPSHQRRGIGRRLVAEIERRAIISGATELALDTAEPAGHLIDYYARLGFRVVGSTHWEGKTYSSVVMSKPLG